MIFQIIYLRYPYQLQHSNSHSLTSTLQIRHFKSSNFDTTCRLQHSGFGTTTVLYCYLTFFLPPSCGINAFPKSGRCSWSSSFSGKQNFTAQSAIRSKWNLEFSGLLLSCTTVGLLCPLYQIRQFLSSRCRDQLCVGNSFHPLGPPEP